MGLFNAKSPEELRLDEFNRTEKRTIKIVSTVMAPLWKLYELSSTEEEYLKVCYYFEQWFSQYVMARIPTKKYFGTRDYWKMFESNNIGGLLAQLVCGQYGKCLAYCNNLLEFEEKMYNIGIGKSNMGGLIGALEFAAATTGKTGTRMEIVFYYKIKLIKSVCLFELKRYQEAYYLLRTLPDDFALTFDKKDIYFNQHFRYRNVFSVPTLLELINQKF